MSVGTALVAAGGGVGRLEHAVQFGALQADIGEFAVGELVQLVDRGLTLEEGGNAREERGASGAVGRRNARRS